MILITADGGGAMDRAWRLWKLELQKFADQTGLCISVCHFPPGTSKWNKIEHRLFPLSRQIGAVNRCEITKRSRQPHRQTTTAKGLKVACRLDRRKYPTGRKVSDEEMKTSMWSVISFTVTGTTS